MICNSKYSLTVTNLAKIVNHIANCLDKKKYQMVLPVFFRNGIKHCKLSQKICGARVEVSKN